MRGTRQNIQYSLALEPSDRGETLVGGVQGTEPPVSPTPKARPWRKDTPAEA